MKYTNIGRKIKYYREDRKLTQQQLADRVGVTWEMISRYERNVNGPFNKIDLIADSLNIPLEKLLEQEDENQSRESYDVPLFTKKPKDLDFNKENTNFFYSCPKWAYLLDTDVFAIDAGLIDKERNGVYYISKNTYPYKKHLVLCIKDEKLIVEDFKNQKKFIGVVLAQELKSV